MEVPAPQHPPHPAPVIPFASPAGPVIEYAIPAALAAQRVWRDGILLVIDDQATLPERCIKCNQAATVMLNQRHVADTPVAIASILLIVGLVLGWPFNTICLALALLTAILAFSSRLRFRVGLCGQHLRRRRIWQIVMCTMVLLLIAGIATVVIYESAPLPGRSLQTRNLVVATAIVTADAVYFAAVYCYAVGVRLLTPLRKKRQRSWFSGAGTGFLNSLPPVGTE